MMGIIYRKIQNAYYCIPGFYWGSCFSIFSFLYSIL